MRIPAFVTLIVIQASSLLQAAGINDPMLEDKPALSAAGRQRLMDNLSILEQNIRTTQNNIQNSAKNIKTIESEIKTLDNFVAEHAELRKKYNAYLEHAASMIEKNDRGGREVAEWVKENKDAAVTTGKTEGLVTARKDQSKRSKWREDADSKVARVHALLRGLDQNLRDIEGRKKELRAQQEEWSKRHQEFQDLLTTMDHRKLELEKLAKRAGIKASDD